METKMECKDATSCCIAMCTSCHADTLEGRRQTNKLLPLLHLLNGVGQVNGFHGDLHFAHTTEEICDEYTSWIPQEKVSTVAWSGHTLTLGTDFELRKQTKQIHDTEQLTAHSRAATNNYFHCHCL